jgi:hypothetical protein
VAVRYFLISVSVHVVRAFISAPSFDVLHVHIVPMIGARIPFTFWVRISCSRIPQTNSKGKREIMQEKARERSNRVNANRNVSEFHWDTDTVRAEEGIRGLFLRTNNNSSSRGYVKFMRSSY